MRVKSFILNVCAVVAVAFPIPASAQPSLTITTGDDWPPFSSDKLLNKGFANDIAKTAFERAGYDVTFNFLPWERAKQRIKAGIDEVLGNVWFSKKRARSMAFTNPVAKNELVFVTLRKNAFDFTGLDSLAGMTIGTVRGYEYKDTFATSDKFWRVGATNLKRNLEKLVAGRIDAMIGDRLVVKHLANMKKGIHNAFLAYTDSALSSKTLHFTVSRNIENTKKIVQDFNEALKKMHADGTYAEIKKQHGLQ